MTDRPRILVIRLGALGDLIQAFDAFHALRAGHPDAEIVLLTGSAFAGFARTMPWFDTVWEDRRGRSPLHYLAMGWRLRRAGFARVYDLQDKPRTRRYRLLLGRKVPWTGGGMPADRHNRDRYLGLVAAAGMPPAGPADLGWLSGPPLPAPPRPSKGPYVLLVPGCSPHLPHKRWPAEGYAELARRLAGRGVAAAVVGTAADRAAADAILAAAPGVVDLIGRTSLGQLADLARFAAACVGNDTGPVFLAAAVGCPTLMLMSRHTDPVRSAPWGPRAAWLKRDDLAELAVGDVAVALRSQLKALDLGVE